MVYIGKMESNKKKSERKHQKVYLFMKKLFSDCIVTYNDLEGHDLFIQFNDNKAVWLEIKTCDKIVCNGIDHKRKNDGPVIFNINRLGRFKMDRREVYPYVISQHDDLISKDGWYLFFVGETIGKYKILFGIKAKNVHLNPKKGLHQLGWGQLSTQSNPNWLELIKNEVYDENLMVTIPFSPFSKEDE